MTNVCIIQGHPEPGAEHLCGALADAYAEGAAEGEHSCARIDVAELDFPLLRRPADFVTAPPEPIVGAQEKVKAADHVVVIFPLWMGGMPAFLRGFFEQLSRADFTVAPSDAGWPKAQLAGRSARVVVTMGMPSAAYRWYFGAHGVRGFERSVLGLAGFKPIRETLFGSVEAVDAPTRERWLAKMRRYGKHAG